MKLKCHKIFTLFALVGVIFAASEGKVFAADSSLTLHQTVDKMSQLIQKQEYKVSYKPSDASKFSGGMKLEFQFEDGFRSEQLNMGNWSDYEGALQIAVYSSSKEQPVYEGTVEESKSLNLKEYQGIKKIEITTDSALAETSMVTDCSVTGNLHASEINGSYTATARISGSIDGQSYQKVEERKVTTDCIVYELKKPELTFSSSELNQLDSTVATVRGISGEGNGTVKDLTITFQVPDRMITDRIQMPEFENANVKLYIDGSLRKINPDGSYNVGSKAKLIQIVVNLKDSLVQNKDLSISMRNTSATAGTESFAAQLEATLQNGSKMSSESEAVTISCIAASPEIPPVEPETPEGPEQGETEEPEEETTPVKPQEKPETEDSEGKKDKVVDLSGLNLQSARAEGTKPVLAAVVQSDAFRTNRLHTMNENRVQETQVFDFTSDSSQNTDENNLLADNGTTDYDQPADQIEKSPVEKAKSKMKEASQNRFLPIIAVLILILLAGGGVTFFLLREKKQESAKESEGGPESTEEEHQEIKT